MSSIRDFQPMSKLGEGTYSTVYKVKRLSDGHIYALKKVKMNQLSTKEKENALNQIRILASIQSDSIISYKEAFFDESINVLCIVMEYADEGDLHHIVTQAKKKHTPIGEQEIWLATKHMLLGLQNLHQRGIMHRDLKSANVFKSTDGYKLGDLNVSKVVSGNLAYTQTGTPYYASPQVWRDQPYDAKSDIWSLGCIIYQMAALRPPYQGNDMQQLFKNIQNKSITSIPGFYSKDLWQLIQLCLRKKSSMRPTAHQLLNYISFQKYFDQKNNQCMNKQKIKSKQNLNKKQMLLQTIKLPSDMSKLKDKLPNSKYQTQNRNKSQVFDRKDEQRNYRTPNKIEQKKVNKSQVFKSPASMMNLEPSARIAKTPVTDIKLSSKVNEIVSKYSDRLHLSDKKSNKVEYYVPQKYDKNYMNVQKYIQQQVYKRPNQNSIPRTEKIQAKEKSNHQVIIPISSQSHIPTNIEQMRRRLVKKTRVMSNNNNKPSWWA